MLEFNLINNAAAQTTRTFNSMCNFSGARLGASSAGLFRIEGFDDHGVAIPALIKSGALDLGKGNKKRFRFFYFGLETAGELTLSVYGDGELAGEYSVQGSADGMQVIRVPISRAVNAWYWEWKIENESGAFFVLHSVTALPVVLHTGHG